jgi:aminopeptidase N
LHKQSHNFTSYCSGNGYTRYEFEETEIMSTYLLAFLVSDFISTESKPIYNFTAWARPNAIEHAAYSQEVGPKLVLYFEDYTGIDYTFPKIDQVAVPDFAAGAMENWGLIIYRYVLITSCNLITTRHVLRRSPTSFNLL